MGQQCNNTQEGPHTVFWAVVLFRHNRTFTWQQLLAHGRSLLLLRIAGNPLRDRHRHRPLARWIEMKGN